MCTLVVLNEYVEGFPLVVAANRDERYDRKSRAPEVEHHEDNDFVRPWDDEKDGTWMGVSGDGWFVGITNQDDGRHDPHALSRGKVVNECLRAGCHSGVARILATLELERYNPFNLVFGRPGAMFLSRVWAGHRLELEPLKSGINVVSNDCWGHAYDEKLEHATLLAEWAKKCGDINGVDSTVSWLFRVMSSHHHSNSKMPFDPVQALCVHAEEHAFGTRSTSIITVSNETEVEYWYSEGHACRSTGLSLAARLPPRSLPRCEGTAGPTSSNQPPTTFTSKDTARTSSR